MVSGLLLILLTGGRSEKHIPNYIHFLKHPVEIQGVLSQRKAGKDMSKVLEWIKMYVWRKIMKVNKEKLLKTINAKWLTKKCPMCGNNNWTIDDDMMTMVCIGKDKSLQLGGKMVPVVTITCKECGNTIFVNPLAIKCTED